MKYVILAGGLGTRLHPYTFSVPKPLLPLGDKTLLDHIINHIKEYSPSEIIISLGYQAELIKAYCQDGLKYDVKITYIEEKKPLGTAGCLTLAIDRFEADEPFILMNGDIVTLLDFDEFKKFHISNNGMVTVGAVRHKYQSPFGVLELEGNVISGITEKPVYEYIISAGIYCLNKQVLEGVPYNEFITMPDLILKEKRRGRKVFIYEIKEYWRALENKENFDEVLQDRII